MLKKFPDKRDACGTFSKKEPARGVKASYGGIVSHAHSKFENRAALSQGVRVISANASRKVVKSVAFFEAAKGIIVLLAGFGFLSLLHRDLHALAIALVGRLHLDATHRFPSKFIEIATHTTDSRLWFIASLSFLYALFRFVEAYGLWFSRTWAEWLALVSGAAYLPIEIFELLRRVTWTRALALVANLIVVVAIAMVVWRNRRVAKNPVQ
ncbi:MAG: DUF2127 domain-containing protein [Nibricoccus sp.]